GREISQFYHRKPHAPGPPVLEVERLRTPAHPKHELSFSLRSGQMVGLAGLVGAGRTEVLQTLFGITPAAGGLIRINGEPRTPHHPTDAIRAGMALVPEDRKQQGLVLEMAVRENLSLASLRRIRRAGFLRRQAERRIAQRMMNDLSIRASSD